MPRVTELVAVDPDLCRARDPAPMAVALAISERADVPIARLLVLLAVASIPSAVAKVPEAVAWLPRAVDASPPALAVLPSALLEALSARVVMRSPRGSCEPRDRFLCILYVF